MIAKTDTLYRNFILFSFISERDHNPPKPDYRAFQHFYDAAEETIKYLIGLQLHIRLYTSIPLEFFNNP